MKSSGVSGPNRKYTSRPARGAWVEIVVEWFNGWVCLAVAPRKGRVG